MTAAELKRKFSGHGYTAKETKQRVKSKITDEMLVVYSLKNPWGHSSTFNGIYEGVEILKKLAADEAEWKERRRTGNFE